MLSLVSSNDTILEKYGDIFECSLELNLYIYNNKIIICW